MCAGDRPNNALLKNENRVVLFAALIGGRFSKKILYTNKRERVGAILFRRGDRPLEKNMIAYATKNLRPGSTTVFGARARMFTGNMGD